MCAWFRTPHGHTTVRTVCAPILTHTPLQTPKQARRGARACPSWRSNTTEGPIPIVPGAVCAWFRTAHGHKTMRTVCAPTLTHTPLHTPKQARRGAQAKSTSSFLSSLFLPSYHTIFSSFLGVIVSSCLDHFTVKSRTLGWTCAGWRHDDDITPENFSPEKISVKTEKEMKTSAFY